MAKILIADDHPKNREYLVNLLRHCGPDLLEADDGVAALAQVRADRPDLVIADILMPAMDGYEFVCQMRSDPGIAHTPVIFPSAAYDERAIRPPAGACGVAQILIKPAQPHRVLACVGSVLGAAQRPAPVSPLLEAFDREHLRLLTDQLAQKANAPEAANERLSRLIEWGKELGLDRRRENGRLVTEFRMADTGLGIKPEDQAKLFPAFPRVGAAGVRRREGTGLGLDLSRGPAGLLGGPIQHQSEPVQ